MAPRLRHAARFALPNLVAVLVAALGYELVEAYVRGEVPEGMTAAGAVAANMPLWALLATIIALVTFLLRLSDVVARVPAWGFCWLGAAWVALACVLVVHSVEEGRFGIAVGVGVAAVVLWLAIHRRLPGWPGVRAREGERDLP